MKKSAVALLLSAAALSCAWAADVVSYTASADPNLNPDGIATPGGASDVWSVAFTSGDSSMNGSFLGDSGTNGGAGAGTAGAGTSAWALYANSGNTATATHIFEGGALTIGQTVSMQLDTGYLDSGSSAGLRLLGPGGAFRFALSFIGGDSDYRYYDGVTNALAVHGFTDAGLTFSFTLTSDTTYTASVTGGSTWSGTVAAGIEQIQFYNQYTGMGSADNVFANNLEVSAPEPGTYAVGALAAISLTVVGRRRRS